MTHALAQGTASFAVEAPSVGRMRFIALVALFFAFLYPFGVGEYSVNYAFVLLPLAIALTTGRLVKPPGILLAGMVLFALIFAASTLYYIDMPDTPLRRAASFVIFMSIFSYSIIRIQPEMIAAFKQAVILASVYSSTLAISKFLGLAALGPVHFEAKTLLGSQRYGFVYVIAFWLALLDRSRSRKLRIFNSAALVVITAGLFLTFSRSAIVALAGTALLYAVVTVAEGVWRPTFADWLKFAAGVFVVVAVGGLVYYMFPLTIEYYVTTLLNPSLDASLFQALGMGESSEGMRMVRIAEGIRFVFDHPVLGTGYLGIWAFSPTGAGSAHNQLLDILIRVGVFGFAFYAFVLISVVNHLASHHRSLFWGFIGVLIYGLFHETFKESHGAFLLTFLVGMAAHHWRSRSARPVRADVSARA